MSVVAMLALVAVAAQAASPISRAASGERVVFCASPAVRCVPGARALGTSPRGAWVAVGDGGTWPAPGPGPAPTLLYFTLDEYEQAMAGLGAVERAQAIARRLEIVSSSATSIALGRLHDDLLEVAAAVRAPAKAELGFVLDAAAALAGGGERFRTSKPEALLGEARVGLANVLANIVASLPAGAAAASYAAEAQAFAHLAVDVDARRDPHAAAMPFAEPELVYFVSGAPHKTRVDPLFVDMPAYGWRGGVVRVLRPQELAERPWKDHKARLMYPARKLFLKDVSTLTDAQINRRLQARLGGVSSAERAGYAAEVAFDHAVDLRLYGAAVRDAHVAWAGRWSELVTLDTDNLRLALEASGPRGPTERRAPLARLRADVALVTALLRAAPGAAGHLAGVQAVAALESRLSPDHE